MIFRRNLRASLGLRYRPGDGPEAVAVDPIDGTIVERIDLLTLSALGRQHWHKAAAAFETGPRPCSVWVTTLRDGIIYAPRAWRGFRVGRPLPAIDHGARAARSMAAKMRARALTRIY